MDCQNFAGSLEHSFVGNWFVAFQCETNHYFVKPFWGTLIHG